MRASSIRDELDATSDYLTVTVLSVRGVEGNDGRLTAEAEWKTHRSSPTADW